ncbi:MAG: TonB-dependent receptor [Pseudomonadota bacterium]
MSDQSGFSKFKKTALSLGCSVFVPMVSAAASTVLDPVTVTATRVEKNVEDIPAAISIVDQEQIQRGNEQLGLDESLLTVPGLFMLNRYNFAQDLRVSMRGFGARSSFGIRGIKIIIDGIPETLPDGQGSVDSIDIGSIRQINVIRGPVSSLYGNASGGAILIESEKGGDDPSASGRVSFGEYGFHSKQLKIGGESDKLNYLVNYSDTSTDGYREHSEFQNTQINARIETSLNSHSTLLATLHNTDQPIAKDPGSLTAESARSDPQKAREQNVDFDAGEALEQTRTGLLYTISLRDDIDLEGRVYSTQRKFSNKLPFESGGAVNLDRKFYGGGIKFTLRGEPTGRQNRLLAGVDYDYQDDDRRRYDNLSGTLGAQTFDQNEQVTSIGAYLQNEIQLTDRVGLTLGARYDDIGFDVDDNFPDDGNDSGSVSLDQTSSMAGVSFSLGDSTRLYSTISTAFETPTTTEFANPSGGGFNQSLKPQDSINYEIGLKHATDTHRFNVALFHIDVDNELVPFELLSQPGRIFYENAGSSVRNGIEISYLQKFASVFELTSAYTYSDFAFDRFTNDDGDVFDKNSIPGIPRQLLHLDLSWTNHDGFYATIDWTYTGELYADNANTVRVGRSRVSNLRFGYDERLDDMDLAFFVGVNNVFDEEYNNNIRINAFGNRFFEPAPTRNVYAGISINAYFGD